MSVGTGVASLYLLFQCVRYVRTRLLSRDQYREISDPHRGQDFPRLPAVGEGPDDWDHRWGEDDEDEDEEHGENWGSDPYWGDWGDDKEAAGASASSGWGLAPSAGSPHPGSATRGALPSGGRTATLIDV